MHTNQLDEAISKLKSKLLFHRRIMVANRQEVINGIHANHKDIQIRFDAFDKVNYEQRLSDLEYLSLEQIPTDLKKHYQDQLDKMWYMLSTLVELPTVVTIKPSPASKKIYGIPTEREFEIALKVLSLKNKVRSGVKRDKDPDYVADKFKVLLEKHGLQEWQVVLALRPNLQINKLKKAILIPSHKRFYASDIDRLINHELLHIVRAENSKHFEQQIFAFGTHGYSYYEEGLATLSELNGVDQVSIMLLKRYAARLIAIYLIDKGEGLSSIYRFLKEKGRLNVIATNTILRVARAGGYYKDQIYFAGLIKSLDWINQKHTNTDIQDLLLGKITPAEIGLAKHYVQDTSELIRLDFDMEKIEALSQLLLS